MDLEVKQIKGKWYVKDRESGQDMNKGKPFSDRKAAVKFMERMMGAEELGGAGEKLMPKKMPAPAMPEMPGMPPMGAPAGMPPMPGMKMGM